MTKTSTAAAGDPPQVEKPFLDLSTARFLAQASDDLVDRAVAFKADDELWIAIPASNVTDFHFRAARVGALALTASVALEDDIFNLVEPAITELELSARDIVATADFLANLAKDGRSIPCPTCKRR